MKVRRAAAGLAVGFLCVGLVGCASDDAPKANTSAPAASEAADPDPAAASGNLDEENIDPLLDVSDQVLTALKDQDYATLADVASEDEKVVFAPYSYVDDESFRLSPEEIGQLGTPGKVYTWGTADGTGDPIKLSFADYRSRFIWDRDYSTAPSFAVDGYLVSGNSLQNIAEYFGPTARWVEYSFPSTDDPEGGDYVNGPPGSDWSALRLVFREADTGYQLVGIVHDSWTV